LNPIALGGESAPFDNVTQFAKISGQEYVAEQTMLRANCSEISPGTRAKSELFVGDAANQQVVA